MNKTLAVTGITGHTGSFFLNELIENHYSGEIRCLVRPTSNTDKLDNSGLNIVKIVGSNDNAESIQELIHGADILIHIVNIHQSVLITKLAIDAGIKRLVCVHTTGIYFKHKVASSEYIQIENEMKELLNDSKLDVTILRPTMIFGDLCDHNIHKFIKMIDKLLIMPEIEHGSSLIQPVNARDLGKALFLVISKEKLPRSEYILSGENPLTLHQLFVDIAKYLGKHRVFISLSVNFGVFISKLIKKISLGKIDLVEKVLRMNESRAFDHYNASHDFGFSPEPFDIGLQREIKQYTSRKNGNI